MIFSNGSVQRHFGTLANSVDSDQTPQNAASLLLYSVGFCFANLHQTKLTPAKFKIIVLFKGILRAFVNGVDSDQNTESDQGHHFLRPN